MNAKRVLPLALLHAADGRINGRTRFQKLAFLADRKLEGEGIDPYDFVPYDYGPFDKDVFEEIEALAAEGLVEERQKRTYGGDTRYDYVLTPEGWSSFEQNLPDAPSTDGEEHLKTIYDVATEVVSNYNDMPISNLIDHVYDEYPEYARNSVLY